MSDISRAADAKAERVVWGVPAIAAEINRSPRQAYHMLETGTLPGAKKFGQRWSFKPDVFHATFTEREAIAA